jgi:hypothetical protein
MIETFRRYRRLDADERALLAEALVLCFRVRVGLRLLSFATLRKRLRRRPMPQGQPVARIAWAVHAVGKRLPGTTCLIEALVADCMLRRHGHAPTLRLGIQSGDVQSRLDAHAWVECGGTIVTGRIDNLENYAVLS